MHDFFEITKIRIVVFDENRNELISCPEEISDFCKIIRSSETGRLACIACDRNACIKAADQRKTQIYRCHAGLTEAVTPLIVNNILVGYLLFGHVFSYPSYEKGWEKIQDCCSDLPVNFEKLKVVCWERPLIDENFILSAMHILLAVANYLVMERMATLRADKLAVQLDNYLSAHFTERFTAPELCNIFGIGKTQLYMISKQLYGCGIAKQVRNLRMEHAKQLLQSDNKLTLAEISACCGYDDYNYFIYIFSHAVGCPPGIWRKSNLQIPNYAKTSDV